jgi:hypothetical protein
MSCVPLPGWSGSAQRAIELHANTTATVSGCHPSTLQPRITLYSIHDVMKVSSSIFMLLRAAKNQMVVVQL